MVYVNHLTGGYKVLIKHCFLEQETNPGKNILSRVLNNSVLDLPVSFKPGNRVNGYLSRHCAYLGLFSCQENLKGCMGYSFKL
jgi:hypothetical protein